MGWSDGSIFAEQYIKVCSKHVKDKKERKKLYVEYIEFLTDQDWDTENESMGVDPVWDEAMKEYWIKHGFDLEDLLGEDYDK